MLFDQRAGFSVAVMSFELIHSLHGNSKGYLILHLYLAEFLNLIF